MYYAVVIAFMFVLPGISIGMEVQGGMLLSPAVAKWYVFWAIGVRLLLAGIRQVTQPRYTAHTILGLRGDDVLFVVRELGFANIAFGVLGTVSLAVAEWRLAAALAGGLFYSRAGIAHIFQRDRSRLESTAMATDLFAGAVLLTAFTAAMVGRP